MEKSDNQRTKEWLFVWRPVPEENIIDSLRNDEGVSGDSSGEREEAEDPDPWILNDGFNILD